MKGSSVQNTLAAKAPLPLRLFGWFLIVGGTAYVLQLAFFEGSFTPARNSWTLFVKLLAVVAGIGFLLRRRWAVYLYFGTFTVSTLVFFLLPPNTEVLERYSQPITVVFLFFIPMIVVGLVLKYWRELS